MQDIRTLSAENWEPVRRHRQSAYVVGLCERCDTPIQPREEHLTRAWAHGPAEACQHITCPGQTPEGLVDLGPITDPAIHTIGGKPIDDLTNPGEYGRTHDMTCPACVASGSSFTTSPRSETYWSS